MKSPQELSSDCTKWTENTLDSVKSYTRFCGNQISYPNVLKINDQGQIVSISQYIQSVNNIFTLTKLKLRD